MPPFMKRRFVQFPPAALFFKPGGVPLSALEIVPLGLDEYEMLRLVDYEGRTIQEAARSLGVSRATCGRILEAGRKKTAEALSLGKAIRIEGGEVEVRGRRFRCGSGRHRAPGPKAGSLSPGRRIGRTRRTPRT